MPDLINSWLQHLVKINQYNRKCIKLVYTVIYQTYLLLDTCHEICAINLRTVPGVLKLNVFLSTVAVSAPADS